MSDTVDDPYRAGDEHAGGGHHPPAAERLFTPRPAGTPDLPFMGTPAGGDRPAADEAWRRALPDPADMNETPDGRRAGSLGGPGREHRPFRLTRTRRRPGHNAPRRRMPLAGLIVSFLAGVAVTVASVLVLVPERETHTQTVIRETPMLADGGLSAQEIYRRNAAGVVFITASGPSAPAGENVSTGTGFVISRDGFILTNAHVVADAAQLTVQFDDDRISDAEIVGVDISTDLALLRVADDGALRPLRLGNSDEVAVGDPVLAIGNPFGLQRTLTEGIVSAVGRSIPALNQFAISGVIQTDAAVNPGNSGGPLLDARGRVIGINSQIQAPAGAGGNVGIAFAVPINTARRLLPQLRRHGTVRRAYLGTSAASVTAAFHGFRLGAKAGALVQQVAPGSPAERAGIRGGTRRVQLGADALLIGGDVIVAVDGRQVRTVEDVTRMVERRRPGERITVTVVRDGQRLRLPVVLGQRDS